MLRLAGRCGSLPTHLPSCICSTKICWAHCKALGTVPSVFSWRKWADGLRRAPSEVLQAWAKESGAWASEVHGRQLWVGRKKGSSEGEKHAKPAPCKVQPSLIRWLWGSPASCCLCTRTSAEAGWKASPATCFPWGKPAGERRAPLLKKHTRHGLG